MSNKRARLEEIKSFINRRNTPSDQWDFPLDKKDHMIEWLISELESAHEALRIISRNDFRTYGFAYVEKHLEMIAKNELKGWEE